LVQTKNYGLFTKMTTLYRAISQYEKDDYDSVQIFRTGKNTLEAKQFFKSRKAIKQFVLRSVIQTYEPPYTYLLVLSVDDGCFNKIVHKNMDLDGFEAINIDEEHLPDFNNCVKFVKQELI
jgi:hypothetical protein